MPIASFAGDETGFAQTRLSVGRAVLKLLRSTTPAESADLTSDNLDYLEESQPYAYNSFVSQPSTLASACSRPGAKRLTVLTLIVLAVGVPAAMLRGVDRSEAGQELELTRSWPGPILTTRSDGAQGNKYGFEGGRVIKVKGTYHLFTSEMVGDPHWVKMRLGHWTSQDRIHWLRAGTLAESSGDFTGKDQRGALWSPMPVYDAKDNRWNLFYVAYQAAPDTKERWLTNHEGRVWRAVSKNPGEDGISGPYEDVGVILQRGKDSDSWEGLQGTDSFFPYSVGGQWYAFYGSAHTEKLPISLWQVGLAKAPDLGGPWERCTEMNPLKVEQRFIENPIVTELSDGSFVAVYDTDTPNAIGYSFSRDGIHWSPGQHLAVQDGTGVWASEVRTPLGLIGEGGDSFTMLYTANETVSGMAPDGNGIVMTPGSVGLVEVRLKRTAKAGKSSN